MNKVTGIERSTLARVIKTLGDGLGEVQVARSHESSRALPQYSPHQQAMILEHLEKTGFFNVAPEGYLPINGMADHFSLKFDIVKSAIVELGDGLGEVLKAKAPSGYPTEQYSPEQQEMIRECLEKRGYFSGPVPEGYLSIKSMARVFGGIQTATVQRAIRGLGQELGDTVVAVNNAGRPGEFYSPDQAKAVLAWLKVNGRKRTSSKLDRDLEL